MSESYISAELRRQVAARASRRCEYCLIHEEDTFFGCHVDHIVSEKHGRASKSKRRDGRKLQDFADLVLDTGAPVGDAMVRVPGLATPVAPGSTVGGCMLVNCIKGEVAARLTAAGQPPTVLTASALVGKERSTELFEAAYDEHSRRMSKLYADLRQRDKNV